MSLPQSRDSGSGLSETESLLLAFRDLYRQYGYRNFRMSKFEKYELYAGYKDFLVSDRVITFSDTNGELLALKPDVTLSIIRNATFQPGWKQKLFYQENVYRPAGASQQFREIMQCGLECIGDLDSYDVSEVLMLAEKSLLRVSEDVVLSISHLGILKSLFTYLEPDEAAQEELLRCLAQRNGHELREIFRNQGWDERVLSDLFSLMALSCGISELPDKLKAIGPDWLEAEVLRELEELSSLWEADDPVAVFDFSVINDPHYYNGIVFQGFMRGISEKLLSGGRYDSLLRRMGKKGGAIGFAVYLGILDQLRRKERENDADFLLLYDETTPLPLVKRKRDELLAAGGSVSVQRSLSGNYREVIDLRGGNRRA